MAEPQKDVLLYGLGAIGGFYAFILGRLPNVRLTVVARSNYDAVKANGLKIDSQNHGQHTLTPFKVVRSPEEAGIKFDYIVCAHKAINQGGVPAALAPAVDEARTSIVIIQNGVGNEEIFRDYFPKTTILSCVTWVGARQSAPGVITHTKSEDMQIGLFPNAALGDGALEQSRLDGFAALLTAGKTVFQAVPDIQQQRWEKVVWNAAWNTMTTLTLLTTHDWLSSSDDATPMTRRLMAEVIAVGRRCGVQLDDGLSDRLIDKILAMPPIGSSMQTDYVNGRPMEVDIILGYPVRKGLEFGMEVPTIRTIYTILTAVNGRLMRDQGK